MKNRLLNLLQANKERGKGFRAETNNGETSLYVYDAIGGYFGVDPQEFAASLTDITADTIHLRINSPGGDIFDARSMQTLLAQHPARVVAHIDGLAASAATFLMMGADEIRMSDGAFLMIHKGWTMMVGDADDFSDVVDQLNRIDASIAGTYAARTGKDKDELVAMMAAETWMDATEAQDMGFVDAVDDINPAPSNTYNLAAYANTPAALLEPAPDESESKMRAKRSRNLGLIEVRA